MTEDVRCPYCLAKLETIPKKKTKCKACSNYYYPRKAPGTEKRIIVTEEGKEWVEKEWSKIYRRKAIIRKLTVYNITEKDFEKFKKQLSIQMSREMDDENTYIALLHVL